ncbi:MAG: 50S ribosomal protein L2 [Patescibacteria group bacterium]|nr:50S ribosomal protein L2 [Patescibacteria group bacterium]
MLSQFSKKILTKKRPEKRLTFILKQKAGRNNTGRITVRHQGSGVKKKYRMIDFGQEKPDIQAVVEAIEYDPNRTCLIALILYNDGVRRYVLAPQGLAVGDRIICAQKAPLETGNRMKLKNIPIGSTVYNIELEPGRGGCIARSAGSSVQVMAQEGRYANLKMPSGEMRKVLCECFASLGSLSNSEHRFQKMGKAGIARKKGIRPTVRGSAMNACDHPHGGGKNKQPIGRHPRTPWGKIALGGKTRKKKWTDKLIMQRRIKKKRR